MSPGWRRFFYGMTATQKNVPNGTVKGRRKCFLFYCWECYRPEVVIKLKGGTANARAVVCTVVRGILPSCVHPTWNSRFTINTFHFTPAIFGVCVWWWAHTTLCIKVIGQQAFLCICGGCIFFATRRTTYTLAYYITIWHYHAPQTAFTVSCAKCRKCCCITGTIVIISTC